MELVKVVKSVVGDFSSQEFKQQAALVQGRNKQDTSQEAIKQDEGQILDQEQESLNIDEVEQSSLQQLQIGNVVKSINEDALIIALGQHTAVQCYDQQQKLKHLFKNSSQDQITKEDAQVDLVKCSRKTLKEVDALCHGELLDAYLCLESRSSIKECHAEYYNLIAACTPCVQGYGFGHKSVSQEERQERRLQYKEYKEQREQEQNNQRVQEQNELREQEQNDQREQEQNKQRMQEQNQQRVQDQNKQRVQEQNQKSVQDQNEQSVQDQNEQSIQAQNKQRVQEQNEQRVQEQNKLKVQNQNEQRVQEQDEQIQIIVQKEQ